MFCMFSDLVGVRCVVRGLRRGLNNVELMGRFL